MRKKTVLTQVDLKKLFYENVQAVQEVSESEDSFDSFDSSYDDDEKYQIPRHASRNQNSLSTVSKPSNETAIYKGMTKTSSKSSHVKWLPLNNQSFHQNSDDNDSARMGPIWKKPSVKQVKARSIRSETTV